MPKNIFDPLRLLYHNNDVTLERKFSKGMTGWSGGENVRWATSDGKLSTVWFENALS